jgi:comEA protein
MVRSVAVMSMVLGSIVACSDPARGSAVTIVSRTAIPVKLVPVHVPLAVIPITSSPIIERVHAQPSPHAHVTWMETFQSAFNQEPAPQEPDTQSSASPKPSKTGATVNLNTASAAELEELPGIGPATAARIVEYRQKNGNFKKVEDLMNIRGIGEKSFLKLKPLITVTPVKADRGTGASNH